MSLPPNISMFNEATGNIFSVLYARFPVPYCFRFEDVGIPAPCFGEADFADTDFIAATFKWLQDSGYIQFPKLDPPHMALDVVLTAKGLEVLNATPDSVSGSQSIGNILMDSVKSGAKNQLSETVQAALSKGLEVIPWGAILKSL